MVVLYKCKIRITKRWFEDQKAERASGPSDILFTMPWFSSSSSSAPSITMFRSSIAHHLPVLYHPPGSHHMVVPMTVPPHPTGFPVSDLFRCQDLAEL